MQRPRFGTLLGPKRRIRASFEARILSGEPHTTRTCDPLTRSLASLMARRKLSVAPPQAYRAYSSAEPVRRLGAVRLADRAATG